jgi:hypothetical protein
VHQARHRTQHHPDQLFQKMKNYLGVIRVFS